MERKNYCYFNKLILYYKHVLFTDKDETIDNCFVENKNTQILTSYKSSVSSLPNIKKNIDEYRINYVSCY